MMISNSVHDMLEISTLIQDFIHDRSNNIFYKQRIQVL